jgi:hypothetical protein
MPTPPRDPALYQDAIDAYHKAKSEGHQDGKVPSATQVAHKAFVTKHSGVSLDTFSRIKNQAIKQGLAPSKPELEQAEDKPEFPTWIDPQLPTPQVIAHLEAAGEQVLKRKKQEQWFPIKMPTDQPFSVVFMGDPHLGTKTLWRQLRTDCETITKTAGMWAINAGDTCDFWPLNGRLARLHAENDISTSTEWQLVKWFCYEALGDSWLIWLMGNHDGFQANAKTLIREIAQHVVPVFDTEAKFVIYTPNKSAFPIVARHDFPGHSQYNTLHAIMRYLRERADVSRGLHVVGLEGHKHQWAAHEEENADRGYLFTAIRAKGYKMPLDDHAMHLNLSSQRFGASMVVTYNPQAKSLASMVEIRKDIQEAAEHLKWLRRRFK